MATKELKNQMDGFMKPATDEAPTMGLYDTNTPQSVREGTPLRLFDKSRARYKTGDVVEEDYNRALAIYNAMLNSKDENFTAADIKQRIGENNYNKIVMNKANVKKAATGGLMGGDPRLGRVEDVGYQAYAEGGEVKDEGMKVPELTPEQETSLEMQMEEAMPEGDMNVEAQVDTSVLDSEEEQLLEENRDIQKKRNRDIQNGMDIPVEENRRTEQLRFFFSTKMKNDKRFSCDPVVIWPSPPTSVFLEIKSEKENARKAG